MWNKVVEEKEKKEWTEIEEIPDDWQEIVLYSTAAAVGFKEIEGIGFQLPYESELSFSGRKTISMKYGFGKYFDAEKTLLSGNPPGASGFDMNQELQVRVNGRVGRKITVNVNYDDTTEGKRDLSVVYKGFKKGEVMDEQGNICREDEIIQSAAFGDINIYLPSTEFAGYSKNVFGLRADGKYKNLRFFGIGSRTKGVMETVKFKGNTAFTKVEFRDTEYLRRRYYSLNFPGQPVLDFPIIQGSEKIYVDDRIASNDTVNTKPFNYVYERNYGTADSSGTGNFDLLMPGQDYTIDPVMNVITFRRQIGQNHIVAIDYQNRNGVYISTASGSGSLKLIKYDENDLDYRKPGYQTNELKNYYSLRAVKILKGTLGRDFILKVLDLSRNEVSDFSDIFSKVEIDFETGIFRFINNKPFQSYFADIYQENNPVSHFIIYAEYKFRVKSFNLNKPNIVIGSERVLINGKLMTKDMDYILDYDSGFITFFNEDKINEDTEIEISYEYMPFGGQFQQTLVGFRGEYDLGEGNRVGATVLYSGSASPLNAPGIRSTPESVTLLDTDGSYKFNIFNKASLNLAWEGARSILSPNVFGKAVIENMEGIKLSDSMPMHYETWRKASNPGGRITAPGAVTLSNEEENSKKINPNNPNLTSEAKQTVLKLSYNLGADSGISPKNEASLTYPISAVGADYSKKQYLELWIEGDGSGSEMLFKFGGISEDSDGTGGFLTDIYDKTGRLVWRKGQPKTEDVNGDGILNVDEDTGWDYIVSAGLDGVPGTADDTVEKIGKANSRLDTQDLNGDGILNPDNGTGAVFGFAKAGTVDYQIIDENGNPLEGINFTGWRYFKTPFKITNTNDPVMLYNVNNWVAVKHCRITVKNSDTALPRSGSLRLASLSMVGNKWDNPVYTLSGSSVNITALNNEENTNYVPITGYGEYKALYPEITTENKREQAFSFGIVDLPAGGTVYTKLSFTTGLDFSKYRTLSFFLWGDGSGTEFFLDLCANENDYYQLRKKIDWTGWQIVRVSMEDKDNDGILDGFIKTGNIKTLNNVVQIRFGLYNGTGLPVRNTALHINDIWAEDVIEVDGYAYRMNADLSVPGWFNMAGKYRKVEKNFSSVSGGSQGSLTGTSLVSGGQDNTQISGSFSTGLLKFLPINVNAAKSEIVTPTSYGFNQVSALAEGRVESITGNANTTLKLPLLPAVNLTYDKALSDTKPPDPAQPKKLEDRNTYSGSTSFNIPVRFFLFPQNINVSYRRADYETSYGSQSTGTVSTALPENFREKSETATGSTAFSFFNILNFSPSVSRSRVIEERDVTGSTAAVSSVYWFLKSQSQNASFSGTLRLFSWFAPGFNYTISHQETYNTEKSSATLIIVERSKNLTRNSSGELNLSLTFRDIIKNFKPLESLYASGSYKREDGDQFEKLNPYTDYFQEAEIRDQEINISEIDRSLLGARRINLTKRDTFRVNTRWRPFAFMELKGFFQPLSSIDLTGNYSETADIRDVTGTKQDINTLIWPDFVANVSAMENLFIFERVKKIITGAGMNIRYLNKKVETAGISNSLTENQGLTLNLKILQKYDINANYNINSDEEYNYINKTFTRRNNSRTWGVSSGLTFQLGAWRITPGYNQGTNQQTDASGRLTQDSLSHTVNVQVYSDFSLPPKWVIPVFNKEITLSNRLIFNSNTQTVFTRGANLETDNHNTYSSNFSLNYDISKNLNLTMGGSFKLLNNLGKPKEDYYNADVNGKLAILF